MRISIAILAFLVFCTGCATRKPLYQWADYEDDLYGMYKKPEKAKEYQETLRIIIERCDEKGQKVPPGIRAEYGYCLYREGKLDDAIALFKKERELWPESYVLMNTLIGNVEKLKSAKEIDEEDLAVEPAVPAASEE
jgi:hypothetical protein